MKVLVSGVLFCIILQEVLCSELKCGECMLRPLPPALKEYDDCNLQLLSCVVYSSVRTYFSSDTEATAFTIEIVGYLIEVVPYLMEQDVTFYLEDQKHCLKKTSSYPELHSLLPAYLKQKDELLKATQNIVEIIMKKRFE